MEPVRLSHVHQVISGELVLLLRTLQDVEGEIARFVRTHPETSIEAEKLQKIDEVNQVLADLLQLLNCIEASLGENEKIAEILIGDIKLEKIRSALLMRAELKPLRGEGSEARVTLF